MPFRGGRDLVRPTGQDSSIAAFEATKERFSKFVSVMERTFSVSLPRIDFESLKCVKEFCSGLLSPVRDHPWSRPISHLRRRDRLSIAGSLFLFRKTLPGTRPDLDAYAVSMGLPAPPPPQGYLSHCTHVLKELFPFGWDRGWQGKVLSTTVTTSSVLESVRSVGGGRNLLGDGFMDRSEFCESLLRDCSRRWSVGYSRLAIAECDGKFRAVSVNSVDMTAVSPLHNLLYDHIARESWCLRGDAKVNRFREFTSLPGEVFVSGDYESATDNLNLDVARHILKVVLDRCARVPSGVKCAALRTLGGFVGTRLGTYPVLRGQLMGNSLSFPLLCLQNYLAFRFFVPRDVPVIINGDDIVFRCLPSEFTRWSEGVASCGLTLSLGKTLVRSSEFSLNSTFFIAGRSRVRLAPVVRSTALFKRVESLVSVAGRVETFRGFSVHRRDYLASVVLRHCSGAIWWSQRSVRRGLGVRVSEASLVLAGLRDREQFYAGLTTEPALPTVVDGYLPTPVPKGWRRVFSHAAVDRQEQRDFRIALVESAWDPCERVLSSASVQEGTSPFLPLNPRCARLLGFPSVRLWRKWYRNVPLPSVKRWGVPRWCRIVADKVVVGEPVPPVVSSLSFDPFLSVPRVYSCVPPPGRYSSGRYCAT